MKCPKCGSAACRESRWRSQREKSEHPGSHPYRCLDCSCRFIGAASHLPAGRGKLIGVAAGLLAVVLGGVALGVSHVLDGRDDERRTNATTAAPVSNESDTLLQSAQTGDPEAQYRLARSMLYDSSRGRTGAAEAVDWLRRAAESGHTGAMVQLGKLYRTGLGVLQNFDLTLAWLRKAADGGDAEGMLELGRMYRSGTGVKQDLVEAYVWFNRAAAALHTEALGERENVALKLRPEELREAQARSAHDHARTAHTPSQAPQPESMAQR
ncbi:tetratricopeptide repeat protein [Thauera sinica]|uniref:Tetratricopeptide repeat protein n=1 Tax=Thauera sinica TaxID=2665146 RepID=A0ABW1AMW0_9RHOO|nr:tetratricopeptide repeat protein [Thauera sp. K11]